MKMTEYKERAIEYNERAVVRVKRVGMKGLWRYDEGAETMMRAIGCGERVSGCITRAGTAKITLEDEDVRLGGMKAY